MSTMSTAVTFRSCRALMAVIVLARRVVTVVPTIRLLIISSVKLRTIRLVGGKLDQSSY